jgi:hypothetical protein
MSTINNTVQPRYLQDSFVASQFLLLQDGSKTISQVCIALESEVWRNRNAQTNKKSKHTVIGWDKDKLSAAYKATNK